MERAHVVRSPVRPPGVALVIVLVAAVAVLGGSVPSRADDFTPVVGSVLGADAIPVRGTDGRMHVVYELELTNAKRVPATLERIEVLRSDDPSKVIATLEGERLVAALHTLDARPAGDATLPPNESRLLFVQLDFPSAADVPPGLEHRLTGRGATSPAAREAAAISYRFAPVALGARRPPILRSPLEGDGWVALNGCCAGGGAHRGAVQSVNGALYDSQRFAIDWMQLDREGRFVVGDRTKPESFVGYGAPVLAAADGTVVSASDGLADQVPGALPAPSTITIETVDGNHVVLDHGDGVFTFYAHLKPGSVAIKPGERVTAGQKLGELGNTGNTSAPHLHFHAMTGPSPLGSDGIPFELERFSVTQQIDDADLDRLLEGGTVERATAPAEQVERAMPLDENVVDFGAGR